jgi:hypothetical protein
VASSTISLSLAGSGTTARRVALPAARAAIAGPPAMKSPSGVVVNATIALSAPVFRGVSAAPSYMKACETDGARLGRPPGRTLATSSGRRPTVVTSTRAAAGSTAMPCTPGAPSNRALATTRFSFHESR